MRFVEWLMLFVNLPSAMMWIAIAAGSLPGLRWLVDAGVWSSLAVMAVGCVVVIAVYIRPLITIQDELTKLGGSDVLGTRNDGWKWGGAVYYAPDDPAVFVPKKLGIGQTMNFARAWSWIILAAILVVPVVLALAALFAEN